MSTSRRALLIGVVGVVAFVVAFATLMYVHKAGLAQQRKHVAEQSRVVPVQPSPSVTEGSTTSTMPGSLPSDSSTISEAPNPIQPVVVPSDTSSFSLVVKTAAGNIPANVAPQAAVINPDGTAQEFDPVHNTDAEWNTARWVEQSTFPASPAAGTSYVYGHACHYHLCPFSTIQHNSDGSYTVNPNDSVVVTTPSGVLTYRVAQVGISPKSAASLPAWASDSTVPNRIVLVTCEFEDGDASANNIVVAATLVASSPTA